jgi:hypothetical protein
VDVKQHLKVSKEVKQLDERMTSSVAKARQFNLHERDFSLPLTN